MIIAVFMQHVRLLSTLVWSSVHCVNLGKWVNLVNPCTPFLPSFTFLEKVVFITKHYMNKQKEQEWKKIG